MLEDDNLRWLDAYLVIDERGSHVRLQITDLMSMEVSYIDLSLEDAKDLGRVLCGL